MRKPKDFDSELKALEERVRQLRTRKLQQLGELVVATEADSLPIDQLAGALLSAADAKDPSIREGWRMRGAAFFQRARRNAAETGGAGTGATPNAGGTLPFDGPAGA